MDYLQESIAPMQVVKDIAITLPVRGAGLIGVVGSRRVAMHMMKNALVQITTHHSYADVNVVIVSADKDYDQWSWARWLPHCWIGEHQLCCVSATRNQAAELLDKYEDALKKRTASVERNHQDDRMLLPYLVFIVADPVLIESREFARLISSSNPRIGASAFLLFDSFSKLPKECTWFVELSNSGGSLYSRSRSEDKQTFSLDSFERYEDFSRSMAPIRDRSAEKGTLLPPSVTFFEGYGVKSAHELNVPSKWHRSEPHKSLAVPIGVKESGSAFLFDISEKAHGPHGLVAGTTGSGKSEVLQTWILSMCANFTPQDVSFVLIDFKGMGLAGTLRGLPHIAGTISDVDENIQRNLYSLQSELDRRKKLFAEVSSDYMKIGDIYDYQDAFRQHKVSEPLSHLIIVVDEFAELKSKFPDFMAALDSAARVGRSLGVHLVLATQKPDGVVTDEIRANSKFKWCLRVANEAESKAVIGRSEAAAIPSASPGRAYIQIGNNEIFELVQTYYSGGPIRKESDTSNQVTLSFVGPLGRRERIGDVLGETSPQQEKELLALVRYIAEVHRQSKLPVARRIWEDSLPKRIVLSHILTPVKQSILTALVGLVDDPRHQQQYPCEIDLASEGHIIIYGAPGTGKTMLLQTMVLSLAERYTPDEVNIYVMDFGSWSMKNLMGLPHMGGVANGNESEKIINLAKMLNEMLDKRKTMFAQIGAGNLDAYRQATGRGIPAIVVMVDNFAPVRELYPDIENVFVRLSREGSGYGFFLVLTATSLTGSVGYNLTQNFKQALSLRMTERSDYRDIVGDTEGLEPAKVPGRGLIRGNPPKEFQTALAVDAQNDVEYVVKIKERCTEIASKWHGSLPDEIPVMPEIVLLQHIKNVSSDRIVIGLAKDNIVPVAIPIETHLVLISGTEESGKTNMLRVIDNQLRKTKSTIYIDAADPDGSETIMPVLQRASSGEEVTLLLDNFTQWLSTAPLEETDLLEAIVNDARIGKFTIIAAGDAAEMVQVGGTIAGKMIRGGSSILLGGSFNEHSSQFEVRNLGYSEQGEQLEVNYGYLIQKKRAVKFKALFAEGSIQNGI